MNDKLFQLAKNIVRHQALMPTKWKCKDCDAEYLDPISRCTRVVEPETSELYEELCGGKVVEIEEN